MANLLDYLNWRGDLTFRQAPFNEVDNLIFSELSYFDFNGIVPGPEEKESIELHRAAAEFFSRYPAEKEMEMGVLYPKELPELFRRMAELPRFRDLRLSCFEDRLDAEKIQQFAALAIETEDGKIFLSFRGTDDTLAGWREDFYLACMPEIPAQKMAVEYVDRVAKRYPRRRIRMGGHSKGGNLAVYSAIFCAPSVQRRLEAVWSNDGPGFHQDLACLPEYQRVEDRVTFILPKSSLVGMLLEHEEDYVVVESRQKGLFQHDGFSWEVLGAGFVHLGSVTRQGRIHDRIMGEWIRNMTLEQREMFIDGLFDVLGASGAETLTELKEERFRGVEGMIRAMKDMEKDTRDAVIYAVKLLFRSSLKAHLEEWQEESEKRGKTKGLGFQKLQ